MSRGAILEVILDLRELGIEEALVSPWEIVRMVTQPPSRDLGGA